MKRRNLIKSFLLMGIHPFMPVSGMENTCELTTSDIEGPFYTPNAPVKQKLSPADAEGTPLFITGTVFAWDCETPVPSAKLDVWHADNKGAYDSQGYNYRGVFNTDVAGNYAMETVLPGKYLNGNYYRPRHIHYKIQGGGSSELTTQLYFKGDTSIPVDPWASDPAAGHRTIVLTEDDKGTLHGVFDISLDVDPQNLPADVETMKYGQRSNRITSISSLASADKAYVKIWISHIPETMHLLLYNIYGQRIHIQSVKQFREGETQVAFNISNQHGLKLPRGIYIMQLIINNQVTDAKRFYVV